jgi:hypothetical protein
VVGALFQSLVITKAGATPPSLHFAKKDKIAKVAPAFYKMVQRNEVESRFKMQVWMLQYLIRDFKESDGVIIYAHDPEVFKTRLLNEGWESDSNHVALAPFATACNTQVVRQDLFHCCPAFAGTKLTNPILAEMEKSRKPKTQEVTRFQKSAVLTTDF